MAHEYPRRNKPIEPSEAAITPEKTTRVSVSENTDIPANQKDDAGAVVFLFPPNGHLPRSVSSIWLACKLWLLELFNPVKDESCRDKRVEILMEKHTSGKKALQARYPGLWYLEVIAVHPSLQSRGLGGGVMKSILEKVAGNPIFLECTKQENVGFYEGFGFKTIEEVELTDTPAHEEENGKLKYWVMIRETDST
ncbi:uncharacterized protein N7496_000697 [Penicillium cataractarum]|uniref:N-acetyltransferase domain-containing protein n=1 Tax=Penicillium cataractarum TaxID=2100454 RepID=A0A9X0B666_9EURO|nr:uncharacterized protein N7496_000697 [Penicillium cataractarum]KAJ5389629.1 hypothetical protein N7496_000697 [Penicillium cataractarum]